MEIFEQLLAETPKKVSYGQRKIILPKDKNVFLCGPAKCGKTSIALLHASEKKEAYIYIDLMDFRVDKLDFAAAYDFAKAKKLSTVIFDGVTEFSAKTPDLVQTIAISASPLQKEGFEPLRLNGLDFEEYLSLEGTGHGKKESEFEDETIAHIFAEFIKDGSLPKTASLNEFEKSRYRRDCILSIAQNETQRAILTEFLKKTSMKFSFLQVFTALKSKIKISKDFFYSYTQTLAESRTLFFVEKLHQKNSPKKIYAYDFALKTAVEFKKDFPGIFENMVFLELNSRGYEIFYTDEAGLFVPELEKTFLAKPFMSTEDEKTVSRLIKKSSELGIRDVEIVTISAEFLLEREGINMQAIPFWQWALSL